MQNWNKAALLLAAIAAPVAAHAQAVDGIDAFVSVAAGYNNLNGEKYNVQDSNGNAYNGGVHASADGLAVDVRGTIAVPVTHLIGAQIDAAFDHNVFKMNAVDCTACTANKLDDTSLAVHAFVRNPNRGLIGLVAQRTTTSNNNYYGGQTAYFVGGEGQYYVGPVTAYAQVTYGTVDSSYLSQQGINLQGQLRYYPLPNLLIETKGGYERFSSSYFLNGGSDWSQPLKSWMVGAKAEYKLNKLPVSFSVDYEYRGIKNSYDYAYSGYSYAENVDYHDSRLMFGVKLNLGHSRTLLQRDRSGASLDTVNLLAMQSRTALGGGLD
ncbi:MAG TPA: hypothetical protein VN222_09845 [Novosphingobium sp.]|nr:hypothetical protein [Novosphingobium sp.]